MRRTNHNPDAIQQTPAERREVLHQAFTGRKLGANRTATTDVHDMLMTRFGTERRGEQRVDTREAAQRLGVSQRTVQRWLHDNRMPAGDTHTKLTRMVRRQAQKDAVRRAVATSPTRNAAYQERGASVTISGWQGPDASRRSGESGARRTDYFRDRLATVTIPPAAYERLFDVYAEQGADGVRDHLLPYFDEQYAGSWQIDTIDEFRFGDPDPNRLHGLS